ncbi:hypothetical protein BN1723_009520, partial [Verticillium longisporum]
MGPSGQLAILIICVLGVVCGLAYLGWRQIDNFADLMNNDISHPPSKTTTMATTRALRPSTGLRTLSRHINATPLQRRAFALTAQRREAPPSNDPTKTTHFGYETVLESEKADRVAGVFHSVADSYDRMNDMMSFGWHRIWKDQFVSSLSPGLSSTNPPTPQHILDIAGGTGDIAFRLLAAADRAAPAGVPADLRVTISDINPSMLGVGRDRSRALPAHHQASLSFLEANAERLPDGAQSRASSQR